MKKRLLAILALVACVAMLFTACGKGDALSISSKNENPVAYTDAGTKAIVGIDDYSVSNVGGYVQGESNTFIVFEKDFAPDTDPDWTTNWVYNEGVDYVIYSAELDKSVKLTSSENYAYDGTETKATGNFVAIMLYDDFVIAFNGEMEEAKETGNVRPYYFSSFGQTKSITLTVYNANLEAVITKTCDKDFDIYTDLKTVSFDGDSVFEGLILEDDFYRIKDGVLSSTAIAYKNAAIDVTSTGYTVRGDYAFYNYGYDEIRVYSLETLEMVSRYFLYADSVDGTFVYFDNGSFIVQDTYLADQTSSDYDYTVFDSSDYFIAKVKVETKLVTVDGKEKALDCNYILTYATYEDDYESYDFGDYEAVMRVSTQFEDQRLISIMPISLAFDEDGEIAVIDNVVDNQSSSIVSKYADGSYIVKDINGISYLYNAEDDLVASKKLNNFSRMGKYYVESGYTGKYVNAYTFEEFELPEDYEWYGLERGEIIIRKTEYNLANPGTGNGTYMKTTYAKFVDGEAEVLFDIKSGYVPETTPTTTTTMDIARFSCYIEITTDVATAKKTAKIYGWDGTLLETVQDFNGVVREKQVGVSDVFILEISVNTNATAPAPATKTVYYRVGA